MHTAHTIENENRQTTRNMIKDIPLIPRLTLTAVPRVERTARMEQHDLPLKNQILTKSKARRKRHAQARPIVSDSAPACNTRSQTRTMTTEANGTILTTRSRKRMSKLIRTTPAKRNKTTVWGFGRGAEQQKMDKNN